jgi:hypothetical protein
MAKIDAEEKKLVGHSFLGTLKTLKITFLWI